jgi:calcineurin-like phosphoesterase family protein
MAIESEKVYFTSDTHFSHGNILKYSNRPYMNGYEQGIVDRYNAHQYGVDSGTDIAIETEYRRLRLSPETVDKHDEALIANWNAKVPHDGIVYHLGDVCFNEKKARGIISRLNGQIFHIKGNHDKNTRSFSDLFGWSRDYYELRVKDENARGNSRKVILCHYAMRVWNGSHHGNWMLYGHSHGSLPDDPHAKSFDCGVDCHNYTPLSYADVAKIMETKTYKSVDHHGR